MKASECKCIVCGKQAVAFWPVIDPDIPSYPYCRECLDKAKTELMVRLLGNDEALALASMTKPKQTKTCRTCAHRERWECGGRIIQYCGVRKSNRTYNGKLKIKVTNEACASYKPK